MNEQNDSGMEVREGKSCLIHLVRQKSHLDWPMIERGLRCQRQRINCLNHGMVPRISLEFCLTEETVCDLQGQT